ncbi:MAG: 1-hydroxycarotenoid 3,4-desaturase CrtD [Flavobacteriales bacterium]
MSNAIVIGSGVAGLAAAIRLAIKGYAVKVFEAAATPGGKLAEFSEGGYRFDMGPSLFTRPDLVEELFREANVDMTGRFSYLRLDEANRYFWEDGMQVTGWCDAERFSGELERVLGVPRADTGKHLARAKDLLATTGRTFLEHSLHRPAELLRGGFLQALTSVRPGELFRSLDEVNRAALGDHPKAVQLFDRFATYNGSDPYRTPGLMRMIPGLEHGQGAFYPVGGMYGITRALHLLAVDLGVRFQFGYPVERILLDGAQRRAIGVRVNGAEHKAEVVVSNMDVVPTYRRLLPDVKAPERTLRQERSSSALVFYWGIREDHPQLGLHNILFSKDYRTEFAHLFQKLEVYEDPTVYINITSKHTPGDAPNGCANWFTMINAPRDVGQYDAATISRARKAIVDKVHRTLGIDIAPLIAVERVLDPMAIADRTSSHQGALYGTSSNSPWAAFLRHPNDHPRIKGLHFCGGSVHPGGGIPLALLSARIATSQLASIKTVQRPIHA